MKERLIVKRNEKTIFDNYSIELPIKKAYIIKKSLEVFNDDDPCIIHQSYVIKEYVDELLGIFKCEQVKVIELKNHLDRLDFLDYMELEKIVISLKG